MSRLAIALAFLAVALGPLRPAQAQERAPEVEHPEVVELVFTGVSSVDKGELALSLETRQTECKNLLFQVFLFCTVTTSPVFLEKYYLERTELARDMLRIRIFYWRRGYRESAVDTAVIPLSVDGQKVRVTISVNEGPPTLVASIRVVRPPEVLPDRSVERLMSLRAGQPLDLLRLDSSRVRLRGDLWEQGYADARIDTTIAVDATARTATVEILIEPGWVARIGAIVVSGNERIGEATIFNSLTFRPGDIYRRSEILRSQRLLYESALFQHASIVVPPAGDSLKVIDITVREAPLQLVRTSGGFNTLDYLLVEGRYANSNWFGNARRLDIRGTLANLLAEQLSGQLFFRDATALIDGDPAPFLRPTWTASAEVRQPWFRSPLNTIGASVFGHRRSAPAIYIDAGHGASATFTRELAPRATASANYRFEITQVQAGDVYFCVNFGVCDTPTIAALQRQHRLSPFAISTNIDHADDPLAPTLGYRARGDLEHASAWTVSDFRYSRISAEGTVYRSFGRSVLAGRLRIGAVRSLQSTAQAVGVVDDGQPILHPRKRFYAGGSQSVRGFGENQLGPRVLTIAPTRLAAIGCDTTFAGIAGCDMQATGVDEDGNPVVLEDEDFQARPLGGNSVLEGSVELRFPIWRQIGGAVFVDGAILGERAAFDLSTATGAITPGFGVRYTTPVGPIRIDVGVNPCLAELLTVVSEAEGPSGEREIVQLEQQRVFAPACRGTGVRGILNRMTLHLSIGQAY
ncbi:MAG TPA: BamA/TamA family outer membrane protein [Gemmatimonadaceae bacterium]|nr:BamA/TamA family outer membrane protein [Gemmatimonadaceae bacterium]